MKNWTMSVLVVLSFVCAGGGISQAQEPIKLTLGSSIKLALEKNPEVQIAQKEWRKSKAGVWEAWSVLMPAVDGNVSLQHAWSIQENTIPNFIKSMLGSSFPGYDEMPDFVKLSFGLENTLRYGVTLTQPLFLGGAGIAGVQMANAASVAKYHQYEGKRQSLIQQTAGAFYGSLLAKQLEKVQAEALAQAEANLSLVKKRYEAGSASGFDKMRAEVEVANLKPEYIAAQNNYRSALTALRMVLGLEKAQSVEVVGVLEYRLDDFDASGLPALQKNALNHRPEVAMMHAQKQMAAKGVCLARSAFLPKLFFQSEYSYLGMKDDYNFQKDDMSKGFTSALSLQIPLFKGFKNSKQYQKARLDVKIADDSQRQLENGINAEVEIAYNAFAEAKAKYAAAEESIDLAEEALRLANLLYEEGASTQLDVLSSQLALTRARLNFASSLFDYQMARYDIRRVTGQLSGVLE